MSFMDSRWEIWDNKALTTALHSYAANGFFDLEEDGVTDESISDLLWLNVRVGTTFTTLTSGWSIQVLNSDSATFATGSVADNCIAAIGSTEYPLPVASLAKGATFSICFPRWNLKKYLELYWCPASEAAGAGNLDAWFGLESLSPLKVQKYPS